MDRVGKSPLAIVLDKRFLRTAEAARLLGYSPRYLELLRRQRRIPYYNAGGAIHPIYPHYELLWMAVERDAVKWNINKKTTNTIRFIFEQLASGVRPAPTGLSGEI